MKDSFYCFCEVKFIHEVGMLNAWVFCPKMYLPNPWTSMSASLCAYYDAKDVNRWVVIVEREHDFTRLVKLNERSAVATITKQK